MYERIDHISNLPVAKQAEQEKRSNSLLSSHSNSLNYFLACENLRINFYSIINFIRL